jgi:NAD(P)-dependent dehydrogenase (short-subunit alcohol dehydrogenase family)
LITGAARGQGRSCGQVGGGADIVAVDICEQIESNPYPLATPEDLAETAKLVESVAERTRPKTFVNLRHCAVRSPKMDRLGHLDVVVANAGILPTGVGKGPSACSTRSASTSLA